jgi:hypothetical protein
MTLFAPSSAARAPWTKRRLWTFRAGVALFALQFAVAALDASPATRAFAAELHAMARAPFAAVLPEVVAALERFAARGDAQRTVLGLVRDGLLALLFAAIWTAVDRRRQHERGAGAMRVVLRYLVGAIALVYGGFKVVPVQFQMPRVEQLLLPLGEHTPMGLLWATIGVSPAYTVFGGLGEWLGGILLFWRRTTTLGALLLAAVLSNVVMLNFCYDIPVKRGAVLLLLAAVVLASRDAPALAAVLWHRRAAVPVPEPPFGGGPFARRVRAVVKALFVAAAAVGPIATALAVGPRASPGPLDGFYVVEHHVRGGAELPGAPDAQRWRRVHFGDRGRAVVQTIDGRCHAHALTVDTAAGTLTLATGRGTRPFRYEARAAGGLVLTATSGEPDVVTLRASPSDPALRVLR